VDPELDFGLSSAPLRWRNSQLETFRVDPAKVAEKAEKTLSRFKRKL